MPIYKSWSQGAAHKKIWHAYVSIRIKGNNLIMETREKSGSKVAAEKQAARLMIESLKTLDNTSYKKNIKKSVSPELKATAIDNMLIEELIENQSRLITQSLEIIDASTKKNDSNGDVIHEKNKPISPSSSSVPIRFSLSPIGSEVILDHGEIGGQINEIHFREISKIYLIDLENKPCFGKQYNKNSIYIGFINSIHHSVHKYEAWHLCQSDNINNELGSRNNKLLYLIEGGTADLVDHFITVMIYPLINHIKRLCTKPIINIVSGDHASWCTRNCLEKALKWNNLDDIKVCNTVSIDIK